jgi:DNA-binding CsgD family transcriptional regulator
MKAPGKGRILLTAQERRVLKLVVEAKTNKEIAGALGISASTAKRHLENILRKLGAKNRVDAAVFAVRTEDCPSRVTEMRRVA